MADSFPIYRPMMRCRTCRRWWSGEPQNGHVQHCACGGDLESVDMAAHISALPYAPYDPSKDKK